MLRRLIGYVPRAIAYLPRIAKAGTAAATAGTAAYGGALDGGVTPDEWIVVVAFALSSFVAVWLTPNKSAERTGGVVRLDRADYPPR